MPPKGRLKGSKMEERPVIKDENLSPYFIKLEDKSFTVMKEGDVQPWGYYTSLEYALEKITLFKLANSKIKTFSLSEYIARLENSFNALKQTIKI